MRARSNGGVVSPGPEPKALLQMGDRARRHAAGACSSPPRAEAGSPSPTTPEKVGNLPSCLLLWHLQLRRGGGRAKPLLVVPGEGMLICCFAPPSPTPQSPPRRLWLQENLLVTAFETGLIYLVTLIKWPF